METGTVVAVVGLGIVILTHAFATVWWAAKISTNLENILSQLERQDGRITNALITVDRHSEMLASHAAQLENLNKG